MNRPGTLSGNWGWRFDWDALDPALADRCRRLAVMAGRV
jgi:4-alpha-glucanotransferase